MKSFGVKRKMVSRMTKANREPIPVAKVKESQTGAEIKGHELSRTSQLSPALNPSIPEISHEFKANRPPLRKYIRKVGKPGHERTVVEIVEEKPNEITLASLKEKFGLTESKMGGIFRDTEKFGNSRKSQHRSYGWAQE